MGNKLVYAFVAGDLFHANHVRFLEKAKEFGDYLIVGVLTDESLEAYKRKPIYPLDDRIKIVSSLRCVDSVVIQDSKSPLEIVKRWLPDVVVHADDWKDDFPDREEIEKIAKLEFTPYFSGVTTTGIINEIKRGEI